MSGIIRLQAPGVPTGSSDWATIAWIIISLFWIILLFTDLLDKSRIMRYDRFIRIKLASLEKMIQEAKSASEKYISSLGVQNPRLVVDGFIGNFFLIEPVSIEPTDIIKRLSHLIRVRDSKIKIYVEELLPKNIDKVKKMNLAVLLEINWVLDLYYRYIRHLYLYSRKHNNWILLMQLAMILPIILKELEAFKRAVEPFSKGVPVGDSAGPMVVSLLAPHAERIPIEEDTVYSEIEFEGRRVYLIKAEGPGGAVGRPGEALSILIERLGGRVARVITVDAALKFEGEESGSVAEGVGAAIGDPGPEKISIERSVVKHNIPLDAVIIKMSSREAITEMTKEIYEGVKRAAERVKEIIRVRTSPGDNVIVIGVGNTIGVL
ncbi:MAG: DUF1512 domain-containing protein [Sulfolobales archaeon]